MSSSIDNKVVQIIRGVLPRSIQNVPLNENQLLQSDLGIASIGLMSIALQIEEYFSIDIMSYAEEFMQIRSIGDLQKYIYKFENQP